MRLFFYLTCLLLLGCNSKAQSNTYKSLAKPSNLEGVIQARPWTKSTESYCAQGSDYFVLQNEQGSYLLEGAAAANIDLAAFEGQRVQVKVVKTQKTIPSPKVEEGQMMQRPQTSFPTMQRPSSGLPEESNNEPQEEPDFTCTVWMLKSIKAL